MEIFKQRNENILAFLKRAFPDREVEFSDEYDPEDITETTTAADCGAFIDIGDEYTLDFGNNDLITITHWGMSSGGHWDNPPDAIETYLNTVDALPHKAGLIIAEDIARIILRDIAAEDIANKMTNLRDGMWAEIYKEDPDEPAPF
jgi:hypothetical protein